MPVVLIRMIKGPTMACYYALKIIKELELPVSKRVFFIVGTDEESGWGDMDSLLAHNGLKDPDFGFSLRCRISTINGEKGNITAYLILKDKTMVTLISRKLLMVACVKIWSPESASAEFTAPITLQELESKLNDFVPDQAVTGQGLKKQVFSM